MVSAYVLPLVLSRVALRKTKLNWIILQLTDQLFYSEQESREHSDRIYVYRENTRRLRNR